MSRFIRVTALLLVALALCTVAFADDLYPPPWRGNPGTTFGKWEFSTSNPNPLPDVGVYPYGLPNTQVTPGLFQSWLNEWGGRQGVWPLSGEIDVMIPNSPIPLPKKDIWVQLTWAPQAPNEVPFVAEMMWAGYPMDVIHQIPLPGGWYQTTYLTSISPNPNLEVVLITGAVNIDEMVIDTYCNTGVVPEPSSLLALSTGLLGLVGFAIRRRK